MPAEAGIQGVLSAGDGCQRPSPGPPLPRGRRESCHARGSRRHPERSGGVRASRGVLSAGDGRLPGGHSPGPPLPRGRRESCHARGSRRHPERSGGVRASRGVLSAGDGRLPGGPSPGPPLPRATESVMPAEVADTRNEVEACGHPGSPSAATAACLGSLAWAPTSAGATGGRKAWAQRLRERRPGFGRRSIAMGRDGCGNGYFLAASFSH